MVWPVYSLPKERYQQTSNNKLYCFKRKSGGKEENKKNCLWSSGILCCRVQLKSDGTQWCTKGGWKWRGNWWMEWVASTLHTTSNHGVSGITTADAHNSATSSRLNWRPCRFKWTRPFHRKTKSGFCVCAITFQMQSTAI